MILTGREGFLAEGIHGFRSGHIGVGKHVPFAVAAKDGQLKGRITTVNICYITKRLNYA